MIENSTAICQNADTPGTSSEPDPGTSNESNPEAPKLTPSVATEGTSTAAGIDSSGAEGSRNPAVWVVPFQSLPQSTQEEMGKELFDDPLLSIDNIKELVDCM